MSRTRNKVVAVSRVLNTDKFVQVEVRTLGTVSNIQRQCSSGELEFDVDSNKFKCIKKDARRPFKDKQGSTDMPFVSMRVRTGTGVVANPAG